MRISFHGIESPIDIPERGIAVLRIDNQHLFCRICESLVSMRGESAIEPYSLWDGKGCELAAKDALIVVDNPLNLPWNRRDLMGSLYSRLEGELRFDEELSQEMQKLSASIESAVHRLDFNLHADYGFSVEWSLSRYLKSFSYGVDIPESASLLDKLIAFMDFVADMAVDKPYVFINLKTFLTENELMQLHEQAFFQGIGILLLENQYTEVYKKIEREYVVDQDFVEFIFDDRSECPSSSQGRICSNGFGAVTF